MTMLGMQAALNAIAGTDGFGELAAANSAATAVTGVGGLAGLVSQVQATNAASTTRSTSGSPSVLASDQAGDFAVDMNPSSNPNGVGIYGAFSGGAWPSARQLAGLNSPVLTTPTLAASPSASDTSLLIASMEAVHNAIAAYAAIPNSNWTPADMGILAQTDDIGRANTSVTPSAGIVYLNRIKIRASTTFSNIECSVRTLGTGLSNCYLAVFPASGGNGQGTSGTPWNRIGVSADQSTPFSTAGSKSVALTGAPFTTTTDIIVALLMGAGSSLALQAHNSQSGVSGALNRGYSTPGTDHPYGRVLQGGSGLTAMPSSLSGASITWATSNNLMWFGLS